MAHGWKGWEREGGGVNPACDERENTILRWDDSNGGQHSFSDGQLSIFAIKN